MLSFACYLQALHQRYNVRKHPLLNLKQIPEELADILVDIQKINRIKNNKSKCNMARVLTSQGIWKAEDGREATLEQDKQRKKSHGREENELNLITR